MRKIEQQMNEAIRNRRNWACGNTQVIMKDGYYDAMRYHYAKHFEVYLHGNHIATVWENAPLYVNESTLRRWPSVTTRSRLRALGADLVSIKGVLHLNGKSIYAD